jgi:5-methylcytosine-specific restriction protein B
MRASAGRDSSADAVARLRKALAQALANPEYRDLVAARDEVLDRFGPVFSTQHAPAITEEEVKAFLLFENNKHWSELQRENNRICADMDTLRAALMEVLDETEALAPRWDAVIASVPGMGKAILSAILLVAHPERYGVWNSTSEGALRQLGIWPSFEPASTSGQQYQQANAILKTLAGVLAVDLWTLDSLLWFVFTMGGMQKPGYFSSDTFELMEGLAASPSKDYYDEHREEFRELVEGPFKALLAALAAVLPEGARELLETEKGLTSRILKNDYGQGGAWPWQWGAFYPKGSKRTDDAQLLVSIDNDGLWCGFMVADHAAEPRARFRGNLRANSDVLLGSLAKSFDGAGIACGDPLAPFASAEEWLRSAEPDPHVGRRLSADEVVRLTKEELVAHGARVFALVYPLVLLTTSDDPMPAVLRYLGMEAAAPPNSVAGVPAQRDLGPQSAGQTLQPSYTLAQLSADTSFSAQTLMEWKAGLERKKQAIFYGPPGTGKTYIAQLLARHLVGGTDGFVETVQFHPAYAYEDFIQGIRPQAAEDGGLCYPVLPGHFVEFCAQAVQRQGLCVLIIDEINRAEMARVFGELMYLLEYRGQQVRLAADRRPFSIPANVRIIGTMNTADRSIALVDHALRRRFAFIGLQPNYDVLREFHAGSGFDVEGLIGVLGDLNREIGDPNYAVGITFFLHKPLEEQLRSIWQMEIVPYLEEYFFDKPARVNPFRWESIRGKVLPGQR